LTGRTHAYLPFRLHLPPPAAWFSCLRFCLRYGSCASALLVDIFTDNATALLDAARLLRVFRAVPDCRTFVLRYRTERLRDTACGFMLPLYIICAPAPRGFLSLGCCCR